MKRLLPRGIAGQLLAGYGLLLLFMSLASSYAAWKLYELDQLARQLHRIQSAELAPLAELGDTLLSQHANARQHLILKEKPFLRLYRERRGRAEELLASLRGAVELPEQRGPLARLAGLQGDYRRAFDLLRSGPPSKAERALEARLDGLVGEMEGIIRRLQAAGQERSRALVARAEGVAGRSVVYFVILLLFALLLGGGVAGLFIRRVSGGLASLKRASAQMAEGRLSARTGLGGEDDLGEVGRAFDAMAEKVEALDRAKEEFFSAASHELRTPVASVREAVEALVRGLPGPMNERQRELLEGIGQNSERMLTLVNDWLRLTQLEMGAPPFSPSDWEAGGAVGEALARVRPLAERFGVRLEADLKGVKGLRVRADGTQLEVVLSNLLANAIKFTPAGGQVRVSAAREDGPFVRFTVEDTGLGIPAEDLPRIFDKFHAPRPPLHPGFPGSGLGLAIARRIVEA
ncbi:MAG: ATP-binding protein, partial [Nitrospinota bacterium]